MEEQELIRRAQEGDPDAFSTLARAHRNSLIQVAHGFLHDREEAMDAAQEVFLKAYRKIHLFKNQSSLYTWLYRIMINHCKDRLRRRKRTAAVSVDAWKDEGSLFEIPDPNGNPSQIADQREREKIVKEAIDLLPEKHKKVLLLRELGGLSYKEISQVLKCREGTVMSRLFHARKMLAGELETLLKENL